MGEEGIRRRVAVALTLAVALLLGAGAPWAGEEILPPSGFHGWKLDGKPRTYSNENLYNHIDGGAEPFLELGFESCEVRRYFKGKLELTTEIYRMSDPAAALGIYLMQCGTEAPDPGLKERHTASENQLTLIRGRHLLRFTGRPGASPKRDVFLAFARYVADRVPASGEPGILARVPAEGVVPGSLRIVRGPITLQALAPPFPPERLPFGAGVTGVAADVRTEDGVVRTVLALEYADPAAASAAGASIQAVAGALEGGGSAEVRSEGAALRISWPLAQAVPPGAK